MTLMAIIIVITIVQSPLHAKTLTDDLSL